MDRQDPPHPAAAPIGFFDSGLGGLSVVREVHRRLPAEAVLYVGDTARVPYGPRPASEILAFNRQILAFLLDQGVKAVVVACNTSAALAIPQLGKACAVPVFDVVAAGAEAAAEGGTRIGVIATQGTIRSGAYERAIAARAPQAQVFPLACPTLVPLVEAGAWDGPEAQAVVATAIAPLQGLGLDALVLGCTHFPHLRDLIGRLLPGVTLVDPAERLAVHLADRLAADGLAAPAATLPLHRMVVSGDPHAFAASRDRLLPGDWGAVEGVAFAEVPAAALPVT